MTLPAALIIVLFSLATRPTELLANTIAPNQQLTWNDAVTFAQEKNPDLLASKERVRAAESRKAGSYSGFLPSVKASVGYESTERSGSGGVPVTTGTGWTAGLNANLNLFSGFADVSKVSKAEAELKEAQATLAIENARVSSDLKTAFESAALARESAKLSRQILKRREENLRLVQLRFESGRENKGSVLLSEAYLEQARFDDLQAQNSLKTSSQALAKILGLDGPETAKIDVTGNVPVTEPPQNSPDFEMTALLTPEYLKSIEQTNSLTEAGRAARASFFPTLDLTSSIGKRGSDFFPNTTDTRAIGITLSFPLFSGGSDLANYRSAVATANAANFVQQNTLREAKRLLESTWSEYLESVARLRTDESFRKAATARSEIARTKYNNGLLTFEDWDIIENDLITRQRTVLQSRRTRTVAEAAWEKAQGKGVWP